MSFKRTKYTRKATKAAIGWLESYYEKRLKKPDTEVVFSGTGGAVFGILLFGGILAACVYSAMLVSAVEDKILVVIGCSLLVLFIMYMCTYLGSKIILGRDSITLRGPIKRSGKEFVIARRQVEIRWNEIERIVRTGSNTLDFYTKAGEYYSLGYGFFDIKIVPMIKKYKDVEEKA